MGILYLKHTISEAKKILAAFNQTQQQRGRQDYQTLRMVKSIQIQPQIESIKTKPSSKDIRSKVKRSTIFHWNTKRREIN